MSELERQTRKKRIDARLKEWGWEVLPCNPNAPVNTYTHHAIEEYPTRSGPCDYALFYQGKIIGIIEAKRLSLGPQNVLVQAQRYARGIFESPFNFRGFKVPFIYSTNGEIIWFQDLREEDSYSRRISNFHTPEALDIFWLKDESIEDTDTLPEPEDLAQDAITHLEGAVNELQEVLRFLENEVEVEDTDETQGNP